MKAIVWLGTACLALHAVVTAESHAMTITVPPDPLPDTIESDTTINVVEGATIGCLSTGGSRDHGANCGSGPPTTDVTFNVLGGEVYSLSSFGGSTVNISGGRILDRFWASEGGEVNISGGEIGPDFAMWTGSTARISGGSFKDGFRARGGGERISYYPPEWVYADVDISGGVFGSPGGELSVERSIRFDQYSRAKITGGDFVAPVVAYANSQVTISGGEFGVLGTSSSSYGYYGDEEPIMSILGGDIKGPLIVVSGSAHLYGYGFTLDGVPIEGLAVGEAVTVTDRGPVLTGFFADDSPFSFELNSVIEGFAQDAFKGQLTITLVPEPAGVAIVALTGIVSLSRTRKAPGKRA